MPEVVASLSSAENAEPDASQASAKLAVQRTEFGVDVGGANSLGGLRALWRGLLKSKSNAPLTTLRPIIVVKESNTGLGMQLRLVAGPLSDAAAAAKICAVLIENERTCETTVFDGQRLAMKADEPAADAKPAAANQLSRRRGTSSSVSDEPHQKARTPRRCRRCSAGGSQAIKLDCNALGLFSCFRELMSYRPHRVVPPRIPDHIRLDSFLPLSRKML